MKLYRIFSDHYFDDRISPVFISNQWIDVASGYQWLLHHKSRESDPDGSEAWIFCVFWIRLPVFNKWREQRNILNDTAGYNQQNPDYGQTTGQKIISSAKKKKKEKNYKEEERDKKRRETCIRRERENLSTHSNIEIIWILFQAH